MYGPTDPEYYHDAATYVEQVMRADFARAFGLREQLAAAADDQRAALTDQIAAFDRRWVRPDGQVFSDWQYLLDLIATHRMGIPIPVEPYSTFVPPIDHRSHHQAAQLLGVGAIEEAGNR
ncbi:hypothetical protein [Nocardia thailandica]